LRATGEVERRVGAEFRRFVSQRQDQNGVIEVWWSAVFLLPLRMTLREGNTLISSTVVAFGPALETSDMRLPATRFPDYQSLDATDAKDHWR
jgi:hypothetical protein